MFEWANPGGANLTDEDLARMIAAYYGMVSQLDHNIGRILDTLDELGLADDTMVVMTTDHGEMLGDHRIIFKGPVHYEGLLRVPLIVRGPGVEAGVIATIRSARSTSHRPCWRAAGIDRARPHRGRSRCSVTTASRLRREHVLTEDDFDAVAAGAAAHDHDRSLQAHHLPRRARRRRAVRPRTTTPASS